MLQVFVYPYLVSCRCILTVNSQELDITMNQGSLPTSLIVVAVLFIISGVSAVVDILVSLIFSHISINFGVLSLFVGRGLLRLNRGWRTFALVIIWMSLISLPIVGLLFLIFQGPLYVKLFGQKIGYAPKAIGLIVVAVVFAVELWQYRVLTRPDIRRLFGVDSA